MRRPTGQRGVALFTVVFLIVVVGLLAITVGIISGQQQLTSAQTLDQTRAYYAARAGLEEVIAAAVDQPDPENPTCPSGPDEFNGFDLSVKCTATDNPPVEEGGEKYNVLRLTVRASRGNQRAGTLVQRTVRAQVVAD